MTTFAPEKVTNSSIIKHFNYEKDRFYGNDGDGIYYDARPK